MQVEISIGELFDKLTILEIKIDKINDPAKLENITKEWSALNDKSVNVLSIFADSDLFKKIDQLINTINKKGEIKSNILDDNTKNTSRFNRQ